MPPEQYPKRLHHSVALVLAFLNQGLICCNKTGAATVFLKLNELS